MPRTGRDSTTPGDIPLVGLSVAMGYANGKYGPGGTPPDAWTSSAAQRFTRAGIHVAAIDVNGSDPTADILDVEPFDATTTQATAWVTAKRKLGGAYPPIIYCDRANLTDLFNHLELAGFKVERDFRLWIATGDGTKTVPDMTGVTAVQWGFPALTGGHYDESIIYDDTWKAAAKPAPHLVKVAITFSDGSMRTWSVP